MKTINLFLFLASVISIILGYALELAYSEKLIGFGVMGLFLVVFPIFIYQRWKNKSVEDYMLTKENLEKMRQKADKNQ